MSKRFLDRGQLVGYIWEDKKLIVTMEKKTADKMKADGWAIGYDPELGYFVTITLTEGV